MKKFLAILIMMFMLFGIAGCRGNTGETPEPDEERINIQSLSAVKAEPEEVPAVYSRQSRARRAFNPFSYDENDTPFDTHTHEFVDGVCECGATDPNYHFHEFVNGKCECGEKDPDYIVEGLIPQGQYVVLYKSETDIKFTITLDNPKGESIDAIQLTCDDPNSQVLMDGKYENIQYDENNSIIVNWSQENPYKKTYTIRTTSEETIHTLRVVDIKVNGEWQGKELKNDELKIYKIENNDITIVTVNNTIEEYSFKVLSCNKVKSYDVIFNDRMINAGEDGTYRVNEDGTVRIRYLYDFNGIEVEWEVEYEIELFGFELGYYDPNLPGYAHLNLTLHPNGVSLVFRGTDIKNESIKYIFSKGSEYYCVNLRYNSDRQGYEYSVYNYLPEVQWFEKHYDWSFYQIQKIEKTNFYIQFGVNLYQIVIDLDYNIILKLVK